jgi:hypothetical protein
MRFIKRLVFCLALFGFIFGNPSFSNAGQPPSIVTADILEPIVSVDGQDIQQANVVVSLPKGTLNPIADIDIEISTPDITDSLVGKFIWDATTKTFSEDTNEGSGSEYVNLIQPDVNNPDTTSQVTYNKVTKEMTIIYRWTLDRSLGSTFDNDMNVILDLKPATAFLVQPVFADSEVLIDSSFDTNTPPDVEPIADIEVIVDEVTPGDVDVTVSATDVDLDPISYALLSAPAGGELVGDTYVWDPTIDNVGTQNVQIVATDPYGVTTTDFDVTVALPPVPETGNWVATGLTDAPTARAGHSLVWDGTDQTFVWGGTLADGTKASDGGIYNSTTGSWTLIPGALNGHATSDQAAVWTGSEMLVWGGLDDAGVATDQGQLYDPSTATWREMSTLNAPSARYGASAIWTGSKFFVWGGANSAGGWYADGALYDPATDTWTSVSASGLEARQGAGTVTLDAGNKVAVWGGSSWSAGTGNVYYTNGGVYDTVTDAWTVIDTNGAAEGRVGHAMAAVDDDNFVIWGGVGSAGTLISGGKYKLSTNHWSAIDVTNAPSSRTNFAFGGGNGKLVIWGGHDGVDAVNTGGVYDFNLDFWLATSTLDVPQARQGTVGVWEGGDLFIWGGIGSGAMLLNTGGTFGE